MHQVDQNSFTPMKEQEVKELLQAMCVNIAFGKENQSEMRMSRFVLEVGNKLRKFRRAQFNLATLSLPND